jgi:hypothetical protein
MIRKSLEDMVGSMHGRAYVRLDRLGRPLLARVLDIGSLRRIHILSS